MHGPVRYNIVDINQTSTLSLFRFLSGWFAVKEKPSCKAKVQSGLRQSRNRRSCGFLKSGWTPSISLGGLLGLLRQWFFNLPLRIGKFPQVDERFVMHRLPFLENPNVIDLKDREVHISYPARRTRLWGIALVPQKYNFQGCLSIGLVGTSLLLFQSIQIFMIHGPVHDSSKAGAAEYSIALCRGRVWLNETPWRCNWYLDQGEVLFLGLKRKQNLDFL